MAERDDDRLGGRSGALEDPRPGGGSAGPIRRYRDEDRGEDPAAHSPGRGGEVTLSGTVESRRQRRRAEDIAESVSGVTHHVQNNTRVRERGEERDRPPLYEGATSSSALGGLDAGMGSAGVSGLAGGPAGSAAMGGTGGRSGAAPGVTGTTGTGYSSATGTGRTGGPDRGEGR